MDAVQSCGTYHPACLSIGISSPIPRGGSYFEPNVHINRQAGSSIRQFYVYIPEYLICSGARGPGDANVLWLKIFVEKHFE